MRNAIFLFALASATAARADVPKGWLAAGQSPADYEMTSEANGARIGHACGVIRSRGTPSGFGTMMQTFKPGDLAGKRVRMTAWARSENVESWAGLWMRVDTEAKPGVAFDNMQPRPIKGTTPWTKYSIVLDVAKDASNLAFGVLLDGKGAVWVDQFDFEEVSNVIPTTDMMKGENRPSAARNLAFEDGPDGELPGGWIAAGDEPGDFEMVADSAQAHSGATSGVVRSKLRSKGFGTLMQTINAEPYRGKRVRLSAWGRSENLSGWGGFWMRVDSRAGRSTAFDNMQDRAIKGTTPWTRYQVVLDVGDDASILAFGQLVAYEGTLWGDDYRLEVVGKDVPVTDRFQSEHDKTLPINLDFEQ